MTKSLKQSPAKPKQKQTRAPRTPKRNERNATTGELCNPVQINLTDEQKEQLVVAANAMGVPLATYIRIAAIRIAAVAASKPVTP